jgi:protein-tyrosine phosphatase
MSTRTQRRLEWEACYNARDLGGYPTADGGEIRWGALVRSDNLGHLTAIGHAALVEYRVSLIVDLRATWECDSFPHLFQGSRAGLPAYLNLPLEQADDAAKAARDAAGSLQEWNCLILEQSPAQIAAIMRAVVGAEPGGVLIHCHAGKDRTGLVVALLLALAGVPHQLIAEDYAASAAGLQPLFDGWLAEVADDPLQQAKLARDLTALPETMLGVLDNLDTRYGGAEAYLRTAGVTAQELEVIRDRLREKLSVG